MRLSANVRQYFIHALKGVGVGYFASNNYVEMSEQEIAQFLDNPQLTITDIHDKIKLAVFQQLSNDAKSDQFAQKCTSFDRKTVEMMLATDSAKFDPLFNQSYIKNLTDSTANYDGFNLEQTTEMVIGTLMAGMSEQKLNKDERAEGAILWNEVYMTGYKKWFIAQTGQQPELPYDQYDQQPTSIKCYYDNQLAEDLLRQTAASCQGDYNKARSILASKVDDKMMTYLRANKQLLQESQNLRKGRGQDPKDLTVADVLAVVSSESAASQVVSYFQTRSREQQDRQKANPHTSDVTRQNKIGNLMGSAGKKNLKMVTKKDVVVAMDAKSKLPGGKKGPWRGYKKLYDKIYGFLKEMYGNVMSIGFVQRIMERNGTWINVEFSGQQTATTKAKDVTKTWQTDHQPIPDEYYIQPGNQNGQPAAKPVLGVAGQFFNKTKARMLADEMRLIDLRAQMEDISLDEQQAANLKAKAAYLEERIGTAKNVLDNAMPDPKSKDFNNQAYFDALEKHILAEDVNQNNASVKGFLDYTKNNSANDEMIAALKQFKKAADNDKPSYQKAKQDMAVKLFHLQDQKNSEIIDEQDVDGMANRFLQGKPGMPSHYDVMCNLLRERDNNQEYLYTAADINAQIKRFAEKDLTQNAVKEQYEQHQTEQARTKIVEAMAAERAR